MFTKYFDKIYKELWKEYETYKKGTASKKKKGSSGSRSATTSRTKKNPKNSIIKFLEEHIPERYKVISDVEIEDAKAAKAKGDIVVYYPYIPKVLEMTGGKLLAELVFSNIEYEDVLSINNVDKHIENIKDVKMLSILPPVSTEGITQFVTGVILSFESEEHIKDLKRFIIEYNKEKNIALTGGLNTDFIVVLNQGIIMADYESDRKYVAIETGKDTLMWFYLLLVEYIETSFARSYYLREYIRRMEKYPEY